jgi:hypothetical protein
MTEAAEKLSPHIELIPASAEQEPTVANLLELYAHDFSEFQDLEIEETGRFGYPPLPLRVGFSEARVRSLRQSGCLGYG